MQTFIYVLHFLVCFVLIGVVLLQRGKGQDLGASLGGGSANTIFGSRGAGNFLTRITTASAIIFMGTSLTLSYLGYKSSDARLFDESEPFVPEAGAVPRPESSGLEEIPNAAGSAGDAAEGGLVEIPSAAGDAGSEAGSAGGAAEPNAIPEAQDAPTALAGDAPSEGAAPTAPSSEEAASAP